MNPTLVYLLLMGICWSMLLQPRLYTYKESSHTKLSVRIGNVRTAFVHAIVCTMPTVLCPYLVPRNLMTRPGLYWTLMAPYLMHCLRALAKNVQRLMQQMTLPELLATVNYGNVMLKMTLLYGLELFSLFEAIIVMFHCLQRCCIERAR
ncbi:hypothetical protein KR222_001706, partial [Zaprionus bogoriensis]